MRRKSSLLARLEENWNKYVYRGGTKSLPETLKHEIQQIALRGARDRIVAQASSTPLYLQGEIFPVDEDHSSICKVDNESNVFKTISTFLHKIVKAASASPKPAVSHTYSNTKSIPTSK